MKFFQPFLILFFIVNSTFGQSFWKTIDHDAVPASVFITNSVVPDKSQTLFLSYEKFTEYLRSAPLEYSGAEGLRVDLPMPDGRMESFRCFFSPVMEDPDQHEQYKVFTYKARSIDHPGWSLRMDFSPWGFHASVHTANGQVFIEPLTERAGAYYTSYYIDDLAAEMPELFQYKCEVDSSLVDLRPKSHSAIDLRAGDWPLLTYRVAISCTGEWGGNPNLGGGTVELAMAKITSAVNVINEVFEREVGIRILLVKGNANIVFLNPKIDPFSNANQGGRLLSQNTAVIDRKIGSRAYDYGHVFTGTCTDVGGIAALGSVCSPGKGAGVTCWYRSNINYVAVQITCHEMGHQFSAPHTFNNCNGNESGSTAYEPGGGSTIMSYSGLCRSQSFVNRADPVYHTNSLTRFYNHTRVSEDGMCGKTVDVNNHRPVAIIPIQNGFTIPYLTPFELEGQGTDADGDPMTYSWEQYTTGRQISIGMPEKGDGNVPLFRSFPPVKTTKRVFPRLSLILHNNNNIPVSDLTEVLPPYAFNFKFAFTVRDNNPDAGAADWNFLSFDATEKAGPFRVLSPNEAVTLHAGTYQLIEWDVANTDKAPVHCKEVDISLFKDSDYEHPVFLAKNTPNDGSEWVLLPPDVAIRAGRIKVKASNSIFFDVSNRPIKVVLPDNPPTSLAVFPNSITACVPQTTALDIKTTGNSKTDTIHILELKGLPEGASYSLAKNTFGAGGGARLNLDFNNVKEAGMYALDIYYRINSLDTQKLPSIPLRVVRNYYENLALTTPVEEHGYAVGPVYSWSSDPDALTYEIEVATNPSFEDKAVIFSKSQLRDTFIRGPLLEVNSLYYWHVRGVNDCSPGPWTPISAFSTVSSSCSNFEAVINNKSVPTGKTKTFVIDVKPSFVVSDINLPNITFGAETLDGINMQLIAPDGKSTVTIWKNSCFSSVFMNAGFDDDAPDVARCATIGDGLTSRLRHGNFSPLIGVQAQGEWKLQISNKRLNRTGKLDNWQMQLCGDISIDPPYIIKNDTLKMQPNQEGPVFAYLLLAEDKQSGPSRLIYTLVDIPKFGMLIFDGSPLKVGMTFTQQDLWDNKVVYANMSGTTADAFRFVVQDKEGGWTGVHQFNISVDPNNPSIATKNPLDRDLGFHIFPNPARSTLWVVPFASGKYAPLDMTLTNTSGVEVCRKKDAIVGNDGLKIDVSTYAPGVYILHLNTGDGNFTRKVIVR